MKLTDEQLTPDELAHRKQARELADAVQVSAFPRAYDKWADEAEEWLSNFGYWRGTNSATQQLAIHDCEPSTEAQIADLRSQIETDRLKSDDPQPEPEPEVQPEPEVEPDGTVTEPTDPGTDPAA